MDASVILYGAPGAGLQVEGRVRVEIDPSPFPQLKDFTFGRYDETFRESSFDLPVATTDGAGKASLAIDASQAMAESSRPLRMRAVMSAIEPGGRPARDDLRVPYRPTERYVGLKPNFENGSSPEGKPAAFEVVAVDRGGAAKAATLNWRLVRIDYRMTGIGGPDRGSGAGRGASSRCSTA